MTRVDVRSSNTDDPSGSVVGNNNNVNMGYDKVGLTVSREVSSRKKKE